MGKITLVLLAMLALSAIIICGQGQTDQSAAPATTTTITTTTGSTEIKDYDITINSDNGKYKISLINNQQENLEVFFDGVPQETIPKCSDYDNRQVGSYLGLCNVGTWKDYYVDRLPRNIILKSDKNIWQKDLSEYAPLAYNKNYYIIDERLKENVPELDDRDDIGLKIKIEYPSIIPVGNQGKIVVELITKDAKVATTPDLDNNIYEGDIKIASEESIWKEDGTELWIDPIRISDNQRMTPLNEYYTYSSLFDINKVNSAIREGGFKILSVIPPIDFFIGAKDILDWTPSSLEDPTKGFNSGSIPINEAFYDENRYKCFTYDWSFDYFKTLTNSANRVKLEFPFHFREAGDHKIAIYVDGYFRPPERIKFGFEKILDLQAKSGEESTKEKEVIAGNIWVLDDSDSNYENPSIGDTLMLMDNKGDILKKIKGFNICQTVGGKDIAVSSDGSYAIVGEDAGNKLSRYDRTGSLIWSTNIDFGSVCLSTNGDIYALDSGISIYGERLLHIDPNDGTIIKQCEFSGVDLVVDDLHKAIWVVGGGGHGGSIKKIDSDLNLVFKIDPIKWCARSVDVSSDGSAWVAESDHPDVEGSKNRLLKISSQGNIDESIDLDFNPKCISVDRNDDSVWVIGKSLAKFDKNGVIVLEEGISGSYIIVDQKDGSIWISSPSSESIRHYSKNFDELLNLPGFSISGCYIGFPNHETNIVRS